MDDAAKSRSRIASDRHPDRRRRARPARRSPGSSRGTRTCASSCSKRGRTTGRSRRGAGPPGCSMRAHLPRTHDWGYHGPRPPDARERHRLRPRAGDRRLLRAQRLRRPARPPPRLRPLGGTAATPAGAGTDVAPAFERAKRGLRVRLVDDAELTPFHAAFIEGAVAAGIPRVRGYERPGRRSRASPPRPSISTTACAGTARSATSIRCATARTCASSAMRSSIAWRSRSGRAVAVQAIIGGRAGAHPRRADRPRGGRVRLARHPPPLRHRPGGRSPPARHRRPSTRSPASAMDWSITRRSKVHFAGTERLNRAMEAFEARHWLPDEQSLAKARSSRCTEAFDLHLYAVAHPPGAVRALGLPRLRQFRPAALGRHGEARLDGPGRAAR